MWTTTVIMSKDHEIILWCDRMEQEQIEEELLNAPVGAFVTEIPYGI